MEPHRAGLLEEFLEYAKTDQNYILKLQAHSFNPFHSEYNLYPDSLKNYLLENAYVIKLRRKNLQRV